LGIRKLGGSDIEWSNLCGNQATHFNDCTKNPNVENSCCNHKKTRTTFDVGLTICVSSTNDGKTQVERVVTIGQRTQR
jgi:hypothetical protein